MGRTLKRKNPPNMAVIAKPPTKRARQWEDEKKQDEKEDERTMEEIWLQQHGEALMAQEVVKKSRGTSTECTFPKGYCKQQIFICKTCNPDEGKPAGFCLACSLSCHLDHEVRELWTRRSFRCDCGNSRQPSISCGLYQSKPSTNPLNKYNHNFNNRFCYCRKEFVYGDDPDMIQCAQCQDWFHYKCCVIPPEPDVHFWLCRICAMSSISTLGSNLLDILQENDKTQPAVSGEIKSSSCRRVDLPPNYKPANTEIRFDLKDLDAFCRCINCTKRQQENGLDYLWDTSREMQDYDLNDGKPEHLLHKNLEFEFDPEAQAGSLLSRLPREATLNGIYKFEEFTSRLKAALKSRASKNLKTAISGEEMKEILASLPKK